MRDPRAPIVCKREEVSFRNGASVEDVLACFEVPPEIAVTQWPRREEKGVGKDVHFKNRSEWLDAINNQTGRR